MSELLFFSEELVMRAIRRPITTLKKNCKHLLKSLKLSAALENDLVVLEQCVSAFV